ncbi:hypothetical protein [Pedobacter sp. SG908]|nr:hypothetical protein [Pedobacter sp. SG908]
MLIRIDQDDEIYNVTIGDTYLGTMVKDDNAEYGWQTEDQMLKDELPDLSLALKEQEAIYNLPFALKDLYTENIVDWDWSEDDSLNIIVHPDVDLQEFANTIRDQVYDVVLFDKDLIIHLHQEGNNEVEEIHINC